MPKFTAELFITLILNFALIHYKCRKLGMFILFQKCLFVYSNKLNLPPILQFSFLNFWSRDISRDHT